MTESQPKPLSFQEEPVAQAPNLSVQVTPRPHAQMSREVAECGPGVTLTIQELGALRVAFLHLLALVRSRLHVAVGHGKHGCPRLHQELAHLHVIAGCCTVQGGPARQGQSMALHSHSSQSAQSPGSKQCLCLQELRGSALPN